MAQSALLDRRRSPTGRQYQPKQLNERHHEILRLALLGLSNVEIAERLSCTPATVSTVRNSSLGRIQSSLYRAAADYAAVETAKRIREIAPEAIETIYGIMTDDQSPTGFRLQAAKDVLDRAGFAAPKQVNVQSTSVKISGDDLEQLKSVALERARANGLLVDVTPDEREGSSHPGKGIEETL